MEYIINVTSGKGSSTSYLILGEEKTALIDCGMAYSAYDLIGKIKEVIKSGRKLDYMLLSHSHYDHISAVPYLRKIWPEVKVMGAEYAKNILAKESVLKRLKELNNKSAAYYGSNQLIDYDDSLMKIDCKISEGDLLDLGGKSIAILETPGHTKCSLSFLINNEVMIASETFGCMSKSGKINPALIISYEQTMNSIAKCQRANPRYIISPHFGLVSEDETPTYWEKCISAANNTRDFVLKLFAEGFSEDEIFREYEKASRDEEYSILQPDYAFEINNRAMIKAIINER